MELLLDGPGWEANFFEPQPELIKYRRGKCNPELFGRLEASCSVVRPWREDYRPQGWMPAVVPGDAISVAVPNGLIPDPMIGRNADGSHWINEKEWCFRREFFVPKAWASLNVELEALGLDYEAEIYLNGKLLGRHGDMFTPFRCKVEGVLRAGKSNVLLIRFFALPPATPHHYTNKVPERAYHLRSQVSVGWDTGRSVQSAGIWDTIRLVAWDRARITDLGVQMLHGVEGADVDARVEFHLESSARQGVEVSWSVRRAGKRKVVASGVCKELEGTANGGSQFPISVPEARLWWPVGMGEAALYDISLEVKGAGWKASSHLRFGLRKIEWQRPVSSPDARHALQCAVNGVSVFLQGMCWVPPDLRFSQISDAQYERQLELARHAAFNLIRVWGGGLIERRAFYERCDEKGLLVWQEFPLACANYPSDKLSLKKRGAEAESIVRRLRSHACLALWCGGNEMLSYGMKVDAPLLRLYDEVVRQWHPECEFRRVSPMEGTEEGHGPWGMLSHSFWNTHNYTLASEVGCPSLAVPRSLGRMIPQGEMSPEPSTPQGFQAEDFGPSFGYHYAFLVEDNPPPPDDWKWVEYPGMTWHGYRSILGHTRHLLPQSLTELSFMSQLIQADSLSYILDEYRRRWPRNAGLAIWQYNESWPALVYSIVDYYGVPKQAYYALKEACQAVQLSVRDESNRLNGGQLNFEVWCTNVGTLLPELRSGIVQVWTWDGVLRHELPLTGSLEGYPAVMLGAFDLPGADDRSLIVNVEVTLSSGERCVRRAFYWAKSDPRAWAVRGRKPQVSVKSRGGQWEFTITNPGASFVGGVYLEVDDLADYWSDNFLLIAPGETRVVSLRNATGAGSRWSLQTWSGWKLEGRLP